jgi:transcriptional regulator with XRE-family HTH domain
LKPTLAEARAARGLSQRRLAAAAGVAHSVVGVIEAGLVRAYPGWRVRLATALDLVPDDIDWTDRR